jgi:ATP-binding cassette subfamily B protein
MSEAPIFIMDEPSAALDARREYELFHKFRDLTKSRSAIIISHRFSTIRLADRIIFLHDGVISEDGSPSELLSAGGHYAKLESYQKQLLEENEEITK